MQFFPLATVHGGAAAGLVPPLGVGRAVADPWHTHAATLDVMAASHATPALIHERQRSRIRRLLDAARRSTIYRERMGSGTPQLAHMEPITRGELMDRFADWVTDSALQLGELRDFLRDASRIGQSWLGRYMVWESSGTSGEPGVFVQDARSLAVYDALEALRHGPPPRATLPVPFNPFATLDLMGASDRYALVAATGGHFASVVNFERLRRVNPWLGATGRSFCVMQPVDDLVRALNEFQPTVLAAYPTAAAMLADEAEAGRLHIRPRCVMMGGETISQAVRRRVGEVFRATVRSSYGTSEFLPMAWECAYGHLHVNEDWLLLEPVDEHNRPVPVGERSHNVLLTNLANWVQPLIRYNLGDRIVFSGEPCACGSPLSVIEVQGRNDDVIKVPARQPGRTVSLLPLALCTVLEEDCGVFNFQLLQQDASTLVLRLPLHGEVAEAAINRCRHVLQQFALAQGAQPIQVLGEPGCAVPRGRSGKACRVAFEAEAA